MYEKAISEQADVVMCPFAIESQSTSFSHSNATSISDLLENDFLKNGFNALWNKMFHRSIALRTEMILPDNITMAEDLLMVTQMFLHSEKLAVCNDVFYHYYLNPASVTHNYSRKTFENWIAVYNVLQDVLPANYVTQRNALAGELLLHGVRTKEITSKEIRQLIDRKQHWLTLSCKLIAKSERIVLAMAFFSITMTRICAQILKMCRTKK